MLRYKAKNRKCKRQNTYGDDVRPIGTGLAVLIVVRHCWLGCVDTSKLSHPGDVDKRHSIAYTSSTQLHRHTADMIPEAEISGVYVLKIQ